MSDDLFKPGDEGADTEEHLREDVADPNLEIDRSADEDDGLHGEEHLGLTPPG